MKAKRFYMLLILEANYQRHFAFTFWYALIRDIKCLVGGTIVVTEFLWIIFLTIQTHLDNFLLAIWAMESQQNCFKWQLISLCYWNTCQNQLCVVQFYIIYWLNLYAVFPKTLANSRQKHGSYACLIVDIKISFPFSVLTAALCKKITLRQWLLLKLESW